MFIDKSILDSQDIPGYIKSFLLHLVQYADHKGECYPSQEDIGKRMRKTPRMIRYYVRYCVEMKLIKVRRRWLCSNIYTILCGKKNLSTMRKSVADKQPTKEYKSTLPLRERMNSKEFKICLEDSKDILGDTVFKRNRGWLYQLIKVSGYDIYLECLRWLKTQMLMGVCDGKPIDKPGALLTWKIRQFVEV